MSSAKRHVPPSGQLHDCTEQWQGFNTNAALRRRTRRPLENHLLHALRGWLRAGILHDSRGGRGRGVGRGGSGGLLAQARAGRPSAKACAQTTPVAPGAGAACAACTFMKNFWHPSSSKTHVPRPAATHTPMQLAGRRTGRHGRRQHHAAAERRHDGGRGGARRGRRGRVLHVLLRRGVGRGAHQRLHRRRQHQRQHRQRQALRTAASKGVSACSWSAARACKTPASGSTSGSTGSAMPCGRRPGPA